MNKKVKSILLSASVGAMAAVGVVGPATAQLDEIIVTAERRIGTLQTVPVAVTAFNATELERRQITSTLDLIQNIPNLAGSQNVSLGGSNSYFMRGIGNAESIATFDVPIGTYIDEVYISRQNANQVELFDVEALQGAVGRSNTVHIAVASGGIADRFMAECERLRNMMPDDELSPSGDAPSEASISQR